ncbi:MAG: hypothetical protein MRY63_11705 [Neomegalonema sp.]|nr:hypothetical protein [Neomegalonema sp.]
MRAAIARTFKNPILCVCAVPLLLAIPLLLALPIAPAQAQQSQLCSAPQATCGKQVAAVCLTRLGAGVIDAGTGEVAAQPRDCEAQFAAYRSCLMDVARECGGVRTQRSGSAARPPEPTEPVTYEVTSVDFYNGTLWGDVDGLRYQIQEWEMFRIEILFTEDFDGNGTEDALISIFGGGNCCPPDYAFVVYHGDGHFSVEQIEDVYSFPDVNPPELEVRDGGWAVKFVSKNEGSSTDDYEETISYHAIRDGKPATLSKSVRREVQALVNLRSSDYYNEKKDEEGRIRLLHDFDSDGKDDLLRCGFWDRWGRLNDCEVRLSNGTPPIAVMDHIANDPDLNDASCKRVGILGMVQNGVKALVCDADTVLIYQPELGVFAPRKR